MNQMISVFLERKAVQALAQELDILISKSDKFGSFQDLKKLLNQPGKLVENLKSQNRSGLGKRVQGGILRLSLIHI